MAGSSPSAALAFSGSAASVSVVALFASAASPAKRCASRFDCSFRSFFCYCIHQSFRSLFCYTFLFGLLRFPCFRLVCSFLGGMLLLSYRCSFCSPFCCALLFSVLRFLCFGVVCSFLGGTLLFSCRCSFCRPLLRRVLFSPLRVSASALSAASLAARSSSAFAVASAASFATRSSSAFFLSLAPPCLQLPWRHAPLRLSP